MEELKTETQIYESNLQEWRAQHMGKYVLIKGDSIVGFFDSLQSAFAEGSSKFGLEPFFVKQVTPSDGVNVSLMGRRLKSA